MTVQQTFILANQALQKVVGQIRDEQMELMIPDEMSWRPHQTVRAAMNLYTYKNSGKL